MLNMHFLFLSTRKRNIMDDASADPLVMPLDLLRRITNNFSKDRVLGEGSYGTVYMVRIAYVVHPWLPYITNIIY
jgi:hypothetical protein